MPYARIDKDNRLIEWSYDKLDELTEEFDNPESIDNCPNEFLSVNDFVLIANKVVFNPTDESKSKLQKRKRKETIYDEVDELQEATSILYEDSLAQDNTLADIDAAICEVYELIAGE